ncbi:MAG: UDP-N-acetylglucosamine 2-epimerase (hydrolyzing) [Flavobacteriaceae bacterium]|nr:UDP-N-acetylglucosamine 2-epimerase (hydrolyzing) [Flavobacteriaceae bacterium]
MKRKICVVTSTRAEYGLLRPLISKSSINENIELQLVVTGSHLSVEFGLTYKEIEKDGFRIDKKIEMLLSSDSDIAVLKSMALAQLSFADTFDNLRPDIIVVLGDRFELLPIVSSALVLKIPVAHIHGGETTEGALDESVRHAVTKMSHIHFPSHEVYKNRIVQLGENHKRVYNVGSLGYENIKNTTLLTKTEFEDSINFKLASKNILVTYHPVTLEFDTVEEQFNDILEVLDGLEDTHIIFTKANADAGGRVVNEMIDKYVSANESKAVAFHSLGLKRYLSALSHVDCVLGNSSSGLLEVPYFDIPTVNIGDRQKGRLRADTVIDTDNRKENIIKAIDKALDYSHKFDDSNISDYNVSDKIVKVLESIELKGILKKKFYDLKIK